MINHKAMVMGGREAERFGRWAEWLAAFWLRLKGYRVLARRIRYHIGEIDLICRRGDCLVFVEVKARATAEAALETLRPRQQRRIAAAALRYRQKHPWLATLDYRFDLVTIGRRGLPCHIENVWQAPCYF